jgi:predicted regulator of Ras-like GTPase activity (Roadblock/LC7/MglB family)
MKRSIVAQDLMTRIMEVDGTRACVIATSDGLLIDGRGRATDLNAAAAVGTYVFHSALRLSQLVGRQHAGRLTMESDSDVVILERLDEENVLVTILEDSANVGYIRFLLDHRKGGGAG